MGKVWKSLSEEEQAKYYKEANKERLLHSQQHPDWSPSYNYDKKRVRKRSKASTSIEDRCDGALYLTHSPDAAASCTDCSG
ncbi:transcription factor 7-like 1-C [Dicentrarchus labrax]|uniref:transcription factor 7-like 1-C n=1 Tax=Dicentrarchus labrax TaxID=13489 RepID=UPI0021F566AF|nr:transcription factor 7-like 1-C [Dicentrarchus labrax]